MRVRDKSLLGPASVAFAICTYAASIFLPLIMDPIFFGFVAIITGMIGLILTAAAYLPESAIEASPLRAVRRWMKADAMSDEKNNTTIHQHIAPQGTGYAADTINIYGKQPAELNEATMQEILGVVRDWQSVPIVPVGMSQRTLAAMAALAAHLRANGVTVIERGGTYQIFPPMQHNIEARKDFTGEPYSPDAPAIWINMDV